ncbi:hypothetical protein P152DRAFT_121429 [Eremomyces bilateralis CBS 781.70]|uniref:Uncharacterized protein n=1 Tax=Eremomyces bilateralis CBS 781.70 TaxID=1392243 RepID=A0A6G1GEA7_9PEZI|nr:uncharacterized protein P152DRAFT_121429 [Eremomyces bilateralis CBS 781.70]KAF1816383.1 hypothetical protein P152DRAFT_121429 [Eremomyces bilateralis CBS 781.70]
MAIATLAPAANRATSCGFLKVPMCCKSLPNTQPGPYKYDPLPCLKTTLNFLLTTFSSPLTLLAHPQSPKFIRLPTETHHRPPSSLFCLFMLAAARSTPLSRPVRPRAAGGPCARPVFPKSLYDIGAHQEPRKTHCKGRFVSLADKGLAFGSAHDPRPRRRCPHFHPPPPHPPSR